MTAARRTRSRAAARAFTLLELLVSIGIILVLLTITTLVGVRLLGGQKASATRNVLRALDTALSEYQAATGSQAPRYIEQLYSRRPGVAFETGDSENEIGQVGGKVFDYYPQSSIIAHSRFPDASVFLLQARGVGTVDSVISEIPERFLALTIGERTGESPEEDGVENDTTPSVLDAWADKQTFERPWPILGSHMILYVHPENALAQAMYGRCVNGRPYFMSAGADGIYGSKAEVAARGGESSTDYKARVEGALTDNLYSYDIDPMATANRTTAFFNEKR